jgi:DNA-binding PadR family transcriptional regulator
MRFSGRVGLLPLYILNALHTKQMSGYEIMKELNTITEGAWRPGAGSIYPVLKSLSKKGYIKVAGRGLREKRVYMITPLGLRAFELARKEYDEFSVQRWHMIRGIMMTLVEPPSLARMLNEAIDMQPKAWERVISSEEISNEDKLFLLKQHLLMLDRHYDWVKQKIRQLEERK